MKPSTELKLFILAFFWTCVLALCAHAQLTLNNGTWVSLQTVAAPEFSMPANLAIRYESSTLLGNDGQPLTNWVDQVASYVAQTNPATLTVGYITNNYFGTLPAAVFTNYTGNGELRIHESARNILSNVAGATMMVVAKHDTDAAGGYQAIFGWTTGTDAGNARAIFYVNAASATAHELSIRVRRQDADAGVNASTWNGFALNKFLAIARINFTAGKVEMWTNGVACSTNNLASSGGNSSSTDSLWASIGGDNSTLSFAGKLGCALAWPRYLTDAEMSSVATRYKTLYGIP
jgi:hypothetical protein